MGQVINNLILKYTPTGLGRFVLQLTGHSYFGKTLLCTGAVCKFDKKIIVTKFNALSPILFITFALFSNLKACRFLQKPEVNKTGHLLLSPIYILCTVKKFFCLVCIRTLSHQPCKGALVCEYLMPFFAVQVDRKDTTLFLIK